MTMIPFKFKLLWSLSALMGAGGLIAEADGAPVVFSGTLSLGAIVVAVATFVTTKNKTDQNTSDIKGLKTELKDHAKEDATAFESILTRLDESLREHREMTSEMRREMREDLKEHRMAVDARIGDLKQTIEVRAQRFRTEDRS